jgi:polyisoprenoid-binding protein YceI
MIERRSRPRFFWTWPVIVLLCSGSSAFAAATSEAGVGHFAFDPHHTVVAFHLAGNLHDVHGTFALENGALAVDPTSGVATGTILVSATSGESGNTSRDTRMTSAVLDAEHFPDVRFRAERVEGHPDVDGTFRATLYGVLTLRGDEHDVAIPVDGTVAGDRLRAHAHLTVPYVAWGLPDPSILLLTVAKTVDVDVTTEGHVTWSQESTRTTGDQ